MVARFGALALALALGACGGDDGGDSDDKPDDTLFDTAGVKVSDARANAVIPAACKKLASCDLLESGETETSCRTGNLASFKEGQQKGYPAACLDAGLDLYSCRAKAACDIDLCETESDAFVEFCDGFVDLSQSGLMLR